MPVNLQTSRAALQSLAVSWAVDAAALIKNPSIDDVVRQPLRRWAPRHTAIKAPPGNGKSHVAIAAISKHLAANKRVLYLVPHHHLSGQVKKNFRDAGIVAHVFKGADHHCQFKEARKAANALRNPLKKVCGPDQFSKACPLRTRCTYWQSIQRAEALKVVIASHEFLFSPSPFNFEADAVVIDEAFWQSAIVEKQKPATLLAPRGAAAPDARLDALNGLLHAALISHNGPLHVPAQITAVNARLAANLAKGVASSRAKLSPGLHAKDYNDLRRLHGAEADEAATMAEIWNTIARALQDGRRIVPEIWHDAGKIDCAMLRPIRSKLLALPILMLDATAPGAILNRLFDHPVEIQHFGQQPDNLKIIRVRGTFGKRRLVNDPSHVLKCAAFVRSASTGPALCITHKAIKRDFPKPRTHFGALRGLNAYQNIDEVFIVGRPFPSTEQVWRKARALFADPRPQTRPARTAGGAMRYTDPSLAAIVEAITDSEIIQAIGRIRPLSKPRVLCRVWLLNDACPNLVTTPVSFPDPPKWLAKMLADSLLPESPREAARLGFIPSEAAAKQAYSRLKPPFGRHFPKDISLRKLSPKTIADWVALDGGGWRRIEYRPPGGRRRRSAIWTKLPENVVLTRLGLIET